MHQLHSLAPAGETITAIVVILVAIMAFVLGSRIVALFKNDKFGRKLKAKFSMTFGKAIVSLEVSDHE